MSYCSLELLTTRYGEQLLIQLSDRGTGAAPATPDADLFARAIADADALIDGYLFGRYALPIAGGTPPVLVDISQRIAIYNAHSNVASGKIRQDYEDAMKQLKLIGDGVLKLNIAGAEPAGSGGGTVTTNEPERPLSSDTLKGYV